MTGTWDVRGLVIKELIYSETLALGLDRRSEITIMDFGMGKIFIFIFTITYAM